MITVTDKDSAHHVRYCPLWSMCLTVLSFKRRLTWEGFFPLYKRKSSLTHNQTDVGLLVSSTLLEPQQSPSVKGNSNVYNPRSPTINRGGPQLQRTKADLDPYLTRHCCRQGLDPSREVLFALAHGPHGFAL